MSTARDRTLAAQGKTRRDGVEALHIVVDGVTHVVDARTFTIRENYQRKQVLQDNGYPTNDSLLLAAASVWVVMRRTDPAADFEQVLDTMTVGDWMDAQPVEDEENPSR